MAAPRRSCVAAARRDSAAPRSAQDSAEHTTKDLPSDLAANRACCLLGERFHHTLTALGAPHQLTEAAAARGRGLRLAC
jgi:hypothetical protein